jgi:hypothetical protein
MEGRKEREGRTEGEREGRKKGRSKERTEGKGRKTGNLIFAGSATASNASMSSILAVLSSRKALSTAMASVSGSGSVAMDAIIRASVACCRL